MGKVDKVVVVVLDSVSTEEFKQHSDSLPTLKSAFDVVSNLTLTESSYVHALEH